MKLIVLSDTHIKPERSLLSLLPKELISLIKTSNLVIHAGDFETEECILELRLPPGYTFVDVKMPRSSIEPVYGPDRSSVTYRLRNLKKDDAYGYSVEIKKEA